MTSLPARRPDQAAAVRTRLSVLRIPALCLIAALAALLLTHFGWASRLETALSDHFSFSDTSRPGGRTILVVVDETVIARTGKYPIDRGMMARTLDWLGASGARRIYAETLLNTAESAETDLSLEQAMARLGPERMALPVVRMPMVDGGEILMKPLDRFARHARLASTEFLFDPDRRARRIGGVGAQGEPPAADWLILGEGATRREPLALDFSIDVGAIRRVSILDIVSGTVAPDDFKDSLVVLGLTIPSPTSIINVPKYQRLSRSETVALAAETVQMGKRYRSTTMTERLALTTGFAAVLALLMLPLGSFTSFVLVAVATAAWMSRIEALQGMTGTQLPILAPPLAAILVWQILKLRDSRLAQALHKRYVRLVGVGQNALVMAVDVIADPAFVVRRNGEIVGANERFRALMSSAFPDTRDPMQLSAGVLFGGQFDGVLAGFDGRLSEQVSLSLACAGATRHFDASLRAIHTVAGTVAIASLKDVTEVRSREAELTNLAFRDALTGLSNRIAFHARLHKMGEADPASHFAILLIDLDGFKKVNDTLGHHAGDLLLAGVATRLQKLVRPDDLVARLGGDEFAILQAHAGREGASILSARILAALTQPFDIEGSPAHVGASIGIAVWPEHHTSAAEALKLADAAMYVAKRHKPAYAIHETGGARLVA